MSCCAACGDEHDAQLARCPRLDVPVTDGPCGTRVERYDVLRYVGGGGFGAVYLARHALLGQPVAMKLLRREVASNADVVARFLREARAAASIDSPHVVRVIDFGTTSDGTPFFVMELLAGRDLDALLRTERVLSVPRAVDLALQCLDGLAAAHLAGVIHRDVKPANVVLSSERSSSGGRDHVKVVDFGLSKVTLAGGAKELTLTGAIIGTPYYMPPEQFRGARDVDARADLYALGVILYQMLSGVLPYDAPTYGQLLLKICSEPPRPLREVAPMLPEPLLDVVTRATAADPDARFQTAQAFADALRAAAAVPAPAPAAPAPQMAIAVPTRALSAPPVAEPRARRGLLAAALIGVPLLIAVLGVVGWLAAPRLLLLLEGPAPTAVPNPPTTLGPLAVAPVAVPPGPLADAGLSPPDRLDPEAMLAALEEFDALHNASDAGAPAGAPQLEGLVALTQLMGGLDPQALARVQQLAQDFPTATLAPMGDGPAKLLSGELVGVTLPDRPRFDADLRRLLDRLARCHAPPGHTEVGLYIALPPRGRARAGLQPDNTRSAETSRCVSEALREVDLAASLRTRAGGSAMLTLELPAR
jgi:serine/threonine-protein kinase